MKNENVSVVVPIYNPRRDWLEECLESVENQTYENIELIIVDDSPDENHSDVINEILEKEFLFLNNETNLGISGARNRGVRISSGDFVTILDQDDYFHEKKIEKQVEIFKKNQNVGMVITSLHHVNSEGKIEKSRDFERKFQNMDEEEITEDFLFSNKKHSFDSPPPLTTEMVRQEAYEDAGLYDRELYGRNDQDMLVKINQAGYDIHFLDEELFYKRYHEENASKDRKQLIDDDLKLKRKILERSERSYSLRKKLEIKGTFEFKKSRYFLDESNYKKFLSHYLKSLCKNPRYGLYRTKNFLLNRKKRFLKGKHEN